MFRTKSNRFRKQCAHKNTSTRDDKYRIMCYAFNSTLSLREIKYMSSLNVSWPTIYITTISLNYKQRKTHVALLMRHLPLTKMWKPTNRIWIKRRVWCYINQENVRSFIGSMRWGISAQSREWNNTIKCIFFVLYQLIVSFCNISRFIKLWPCSPLDWLGPYHFYRENNLFQGNQLHQFYGIS